MEIGYAVVRSHWGRRIATEAVRQLMGIIRKRSDVDRVVAHTPLDRPESARVVEKAGFTFVREIEDTHEGATLRVKEWELRLDRPLSSSPTATSHRLASPEGLFNTRSGERQERSSLQPVKRILRGVKRDPGSLSQSPPETGPERAIGHRPRRASTLHGGRGDHARDWRLRMSATRRQKGEAPTTSPRSGLLFNMRSPFLKSDELAPAEGLEPPTRWLTATCSAD